ncbi:hypothetical protein LshimejAT787_0209000 [Lyophyllum shimeji]|uniref:Uncharacterized protein n=1 Tax=Lyophyllum shimeji TaxID=47721 RepID=A0A9P3UL82_LYOSH|nr:hypothetical protein LshimejAT787_0209000 [Lyophyllum shimeji]
MTIRIPYFTKKAEVKQARREAQLRKMQNSPLITIGDCTLVNPVYRGPKPYRGPEVTDPRNLGRAFIAVRGAKITAPQTAKPSGEEARNKSCALGRVTVRNSAI